MKFTIVLLLCFGLASLVSSQATYASSNAPATAAPATSAPATSAPATSAPATSAPATSAPATSAPATQAPTSDATYQSLLTALAWDTIALNKIACANQGTANPGLFLSTITGVDNANNILLSLDSSNQGAVCLQSVQKIGAAESNIVTHANDNIGCPAGLTANGAVTDGKSGGGLSGEAYYQCVLQQEGKDLNALIAAANSAVGTGGQYQQMVVKLNNDVNALQKIINTNDASANCVTTTQSLASDLKGFLALVGNNGIAGCGSTATTAGTSATVASTAAPATTMGSAGGGSAYGK